MQLCDELRKEAPTEEHVLHTVRLVYGRANRVAEVTAMYQAAAAAAPDRPELLEGVFAAHIRCIRRFQAHAPMDNSVSWTCQGNTLVTTIKRTSVQQVRCSMP